MPSVNNIVEKNLEILKASSGADNLVLANVSLTLAEWNSKLGEFPSAIEAIKYVMIFLLIFNKTLAQYEYIYGKSDGKTCKVREKYANILYKQGSLMEAIGELKKVETHKKQIYGEDNYKLGLLCKLLGTWLIEAKQGEDAKEYLQRAARAIGKVKGRIQTSSKKESSNKIKIKQIERSFDKEKESIPLIGEAKKSTPAKKSPDKKKKKGKKKIVVMRKKD